MCRFVDNYVYLKKVAVSTGALLLVLQRFYIVYGMAARKQARMFLFIVYRKFTINYDILQCGERTNT